MDWPPESGVQNLQAWLRSHGVRAESLLPNLKATAHGPLELFDSPWLATFFDTQLFWVTSLDDLSLHLRVVKDQPMVELWSDRIFLESAVASASLGPWTNDPHQMSAIRGGRTIMTRPAIPGAPDPASSNARPILTYLVNELRAGTNATPYSMVTAAGSPWTPPDLRDDEIIVNQWLADELQIKPGVALDLAYFLAESGARLVERTNRFRVRAVVPLSGIHDDRT